MWLAVLTVETEPQSRYMWTALGIAPWEDDHGRGRKTFLSNILWPLPLLLDWPLFYFYVHRFIYLLWAIRIFWFLKITMGGDSAGDRLSFLVTWDDPLSGLTRCSVSIKSFLPLKLYICHPGSSTWRSTLKTPQSRWVTTEARRFSWRKQSQLRSKSAIWIRP